MNVHPTLQAPASDAAAQDPQDALTARALFDTGRYACVLVRGADVFTSQRRGVAPLLDWLDAGSPGPGCAVADRVIGKAAALLLVHGGAQNVYASVMSRGAAAVFVRYGVAHTYGALTERVLNRTRTGPCPMEATVAQIDEPSMARAAIEQTLERLRLAGGETPPDQKTV